MASKVRAFEVELVTHWIHWVCVGDAVWVRGAHGWLVSECTPDGLARTPRVVELTPAQAKKLNAARLKATKKLKG